MKIVVDAFGGDNAPKAIVEGAAMAVKEYGVEIILAGDEEKIKAVASENNISLDHIEIVHASEVVSMHDDPSSVIKTKKDSSMAVALKTLADGKADAIVSAGSTGALVVGSTMIVKRIKGVKRAALAGMIPAASAPYLMLDVGANADCRPEMLAQFGIMGSVYMERVRGKQNPTIGLLNIGTEETKGGELQQQSYKLLEKAPINFIGNVESREIPSGVCDVVVADGFTGNIALKLIEGVSSTMFSMIKKIFTKNFFTKLSVLALKGGLTDMKKNADYTEIGGAPLLGTSKPVIKAHGSSNAKAIKNAIHQAMLFVENDVIGKITDDLAKYALNTGTAEE